VTGEFVRVGSASELADGDLAAYEVDGRYLAVARVGDEYCAFDDVCTHRACSLSEGELDGSVVVCPCHAGEFDVHTGEVVGGPPPEPVRTYMVRVTGDDLEIEA
jgi:3-phenylpropionate/trans-cinnamate dioxygenase ferredoxin subunit